MRSKFCLAVLAMSLAALSGCATVADEQQAVPEDPTRPRGQAEPLGLKSSPIETDAIAFHLPTETRPATVLLR